MIYTTYFDNIKNLPNNIVTISICGKAPEWYTGEKYKKLAPKYGFFMEWKKNKDNKYYIEHFDDEVLSTLNQLDVVRELYEIAGEDKDIAIVCHEPIGFCHRHLVASWMRKCDIKIKEWTV